MRGENVVPFFTWLFGKKRTRPRRRWSNGRPPLPSRSPKRTPPRREPALAAEEPKPAAPAARRTGGPPGAAPEPAALPATPPPPLGAEKPGPVEGLRTGAGVGRDAPWPVEPRRLACPSSAELEPSPFWPLQPEAVGAGVWKNTNRSGLTAKLEPGGTSGARRPWRLRRPCDRANREILSCRGAERSLYSLYS